MVSGNRKAGPHTGCGGALHVATQVGVAAGLAIGAPADSARASTAAAEDLESVFMDDFSGELYLDDEFKDTIKLDCLLETHL
jgi:hypothetical protein